MPATALLLITDAYGPQVNGVVRTLEMTLLLLRERGWDIQVVEPSLFRTAAVPCDVGLRLALPPYGMEQRIRDFLERTKGLPRAIHVSTEGPLGLAARNVLRRMGLAFTTAYHTNFPSYFARFGLPTAWTYRALRWFHQPASSVMVPTPAVARCLERQGFQKVAIWGRGVDHALFHPRHDRKPLGYPRPIWLSVGRLSREKGLDDFLSLDLPGTKLVVGDGPDAERLRRLYPDAVFLGARFGEDLASLYGGSDVFVFPSRFDTFGLVMAEAISCGTPVAAYPVTGPVDVVTEGKSGVLDGNLLHACQEALHLDRRLVAMAGEEFSWRRATDQFVANLAFLRPERTA